VAEPIQQTRNDSDRRRSSRVMLIIPVEVKWMTKDGPWVQEHADTEVVSQHGAMLKMKSRPSVGAQIEIRRPALGQSVKAKVVGMGNPSTDGMARIAVEMLAPNDTFWGVCFPPLATITAPPAKPLAAPKTAKGGVTKPTRPANEPVSSR